MNETGPLGLKEHLANQKSWNKVLFFLVFYYIFRLCKGDFALGGRGCAKWGLGIDLPIIYKVGNHGKICHLDTHMPWIIKFTIIFGYLSVFLICVLCPLFCSWGHVFDWINLKIKIHEFAWNQLSLMMPNNIKLTYSFQMSSMKLLSSGRTLVIQKLRETMMIFFRSIFVVL